MPRLSASSPADLLQHDVQRAGLALACPFACSSEFEAAVIRARRRAGAYRMVRLRRYAMVVACLTIAAAMTATTYLLT